MRGKKGFTLLELLIALVIVGMLVIISSTNMLSWLEHSSAVGFQRELLARHSDARTRAMGTNRQHRVLFDLTAGTARLQMGNAGTNSTGWSDVGSPVAGGRGARIQEIVNDTNPPGTVTAPSTFAFIFNPGGQVLTQDNALTIRPLGVARVRIEAANPADRATIRLFGWTSKARIEDDWPSP